MYHLSVLLADANLSFSDVISKLKKDIKLKALCKIIYINARLH